VSFFNNCSLLQYSALKLASRMTTNLCCFRIAGRYVGTPELYVWQEKFTKVYVCKVNFTKVKKGKPLTS
jgi:hypothetical protein